MGSDVPVWQAASLTRRVLGSTIDYAIVMIPAGALGAMAAEFGWPPLVRLITQGSGAAALGIVVSKEWLTFAAPLTGAILALPAVQFLYQVTMLGWRGRTVGKMWTGIRLGLAVPGAPRLRGRRVLRRAFTTMFLETGLVSIALVLVIAGQFLIGMVVWAVAVAAFWVNALVALGTRRRTIIDRLAGTVVVRPVVKVQVPAQAVEFALKVSDMAQIAGQKGAEYAISVARTMPKVEIVTGEIVTGKRAHEGAPIQQALNSRLGQRAQAWAGGAAQARQAWKDQLEERKPADPE